MGVPCPHVWPMQVWWETPNAGYMMRQHFAANLYERLSTRPFLTPLEKVRGHQQGQQTAAGRMCCQRAVVDAAAVL